MKVTKLLIPTSFFLLLTAFMASGASPNGSFLMSFWGTDTDISSPATLQDFQDCNTLDVVDEIYGNRSARIYIKNDGNYLWVAFRLKWTYVEENINDSTAILSIDGDHDGFWAEDCKIIKNNTLTDGYYLRGDPAIYPDVDQTPDFSGRWAEVDARAEQGGANEQLLYFAVPLTNNEYLYDMNVPDINNRLIGIGLLIENENETIQFIGQSTSKGDSSGFLTISLASAGDVPAPEYQPGGGGTQTTTDYDNGGIHGAAPGFELVISLVAIGAIVALSRLYSRRDR